MKVKEALKKGLRRSPSMALTVARVYSLALGVRANIALFLRFPCVYIASDVLLGLIVIAIIVVIVRRRRKERTNTDRTNFTDDADQS